ncbi:hypothetical protein AB4072_01020 [Microvirga sp. 2MCAF38]|uniref:M10 family metallopeptidase C-terminal domain-containing protein n=1 Tax=Microvirga sp. 2MCAF38 TaxID=3232989 RepID=UPI003F95D71C
MAITIKLTAAEAYAKGVNFNTYMVSYFADFAFEGWPYILGGSSTYKGDQLVLLDNIDGRNTKAMVLDGSNFEYYFASHIMTGTLKSIKLGTLGDSYSSSKSSFTQDASKHIVNYAAPLEISGLSISGSTAGGPFHDLVSGLMGGVSAGGRSTNPSLLKSALASQAQKLIGSSGADTYTGTKYNDTIRGNGGNDTLDGGAGVDTAIYSSTKSNYSITRYTNGTIKVVDKRSGSPDGSDTLKNIEKLKFSDGTIEATSLPAISSTKTIIGTAAGDILNGTTGVDLIKGEAGNDKIYGGRGADKLYGGADADAFVFKSIKDSTVAASGRDTIYDFSRKQGDKIDLRTIDANTILKGNQAFKFIGTKDFSEKAGELRYEKVKGGVYIYGDVNGDGQADFSIHLKSIASLVKGDFYL